MTTETQFQQPHDVLRDEVISALIDMQRTLEGPYDITLLRSALIQARNNIQIAIHRYDNSKGGR